MNASQITRRRMLAAGGGALASEIRLALDRTRSE
jgi:hypothetical protein